MEFLADKKADELLLELRTKKKERGYTDLIISQKSGVPFRTVQEIMAGRVRNPRIRTYIAIAQALKDDK